MNLDSKKDENEDENDEKPKNTPNIKIKNINRTSDNRSNLGRINDNDYDVEELKRQILKKR